MPDRRLQRARAALPEGYQFGDARGVLVTERVDFTDPRDGKGYFAMMPRWHYPSDPSENAAERVAHTQSVDDVD